MSRGWANASACRLQMTLSCAVLCHIVSLQYLSRPSLHRFAGLPCRLFLSYGLQVVTREVHRSSLRRLICPAHDHFHCRQHPYKREQCADKNVQGYMYLGQHYSLKEKNQTKRYNEESWQAGRHTPNTGISSKATLSSA